MSCDIESQSYECFAELKVQSIKSTRRLQFTSYGYSDGRKSEQTKNKRKKVCYATKAGISKVAWSFFLFVGDETEKVSCQKSSLLGLLNYLVFSVDFCAAFHEIFFLFSGADTQFVSIRKDLSFKLPTANLFRFMTTQPHCIALNGLNKFVHLHSPFIHSNSRSLPQEA